MPGTTARELMHEGCTCIKASNTIVEAAETMAEQGIGSLPICGADDKLHGMLTDRDIVVKCIAQGKDPKTCTAGELAEGTLIWINADATAQQVLSTMEEHQIRRLPVIDENKRLVGIISQGDVAVHLAERKTGELVGAVSTGPADVGPDEH